VTVQTHISAQTHHPRDKINRDEIKTQNEVRKAEKKK